MIMSENGTKNCHLLFTEVRRFRYKNITPDENQVRVTPVPKRNVNIAEENGEPASATCSVVQYSKNISLLTK